MQVYELGYLILPSIAEGELPGVVSKLKAAIAKVEGTELIGEDPFKIDLSYTMTKTVGASRYVVNEAYIGWVKFEMEAGKVASLSDTVSQMDEVLRSIIIKVPKETSFTFAKAQAALEEKEAMEAKAKEEAEAPAPTEEAVIQ